MPANIIFEGNGQSGQPKDQRPKPLRTNNEQHSTKHWHRCFLHRSDCKSHFPSCLHCIFNTLQRFASPTCHE